jgi:cytochrome c-type biogenesis protein
MDNKRWSIFISSVFFVLGFSIVFSLVGVLLQSALSSVSIEFQKWLSWAGGAIIIFFGIYLLGLIHISFLQKEYKFHIHKKFKSKYLTAFVFGAAFAVGWTPCVGAILGAILTLAVTQPASAFLLLFSYSLGLGIPFLVVGLFTNKAQSFISKSGKLLRYFNYLFGIVLIILGIFIFTNRLSLIANFEFLSNILIGLDAGISSGNLNVAIAFIAGLVSFLSPCVLPLIPAFLAYLGTTIEKNDPKQK